MKNGSNRRFTELLLAGLACACASAPDQPEPTEPNEPAEPTEPAGSGSAPAGEDRGDDAAPVLPPGAAAAAAAFPEAHAVNSLVMGAPGGATVEGVPVDGFVDLQYLGRSTAGADDHNLFGTVSVNVGDSSRHPVTGSVMARGLADLNGAQQEFGSLQNTWDGDGTVYLYHAYADIHVAPGLDLLRVGRQMDVETPVPAFYDGAYALSQEMGDAGFQVGAYGGVPAYLYETSRSGDALFGALAQVRPWEGGRARLDWMHVEDDYLGTTADDDLFAVSLWQRVAAKLHAEAIYTRLSDQNNNATVRASWYEPEADLTVRAFYVNLFTTQTDLTATLDPFTRSLGPLEPYQQFGAVASKGLGEEVHLDLGVDLRRITDRDDENATNQDFERYYLTAGWLPVPDLVLSGTAEYWNGRDDETGTWGLDATKNFDDVVRASIGSFYSFFKYDSFAGTDRDHVRTYYVQVQGRTTESSRLRLRYEFEDSDDRDFSVLRLGWTWTF